MDKLSMELDEAHGVVKVRYETLIALDELQRQAPGILAAMMAKRFEDASANLIAGHQENASKG